MLLFSNALRQTRFADDLTTFFFFFFSSGGCGTFGGNAWKVSWWQSYSPYCGWLGLVIGCFEFDLVLPNSTIERSKDLKFQGKGHTIFITKKCHNSNIFKL